MRGPLTVFTSLLVAAVVALSTGAAGADPSGRSNDPQTLLTWNSVAVSTLATAKLPPPEQWLYTVYVQSAVYDAVVAIDRRAPQYRLHLHASHPASTDAAIAAAAHDILVAYFPVQSPTLDSAYGTSLALVPDGTAKTEGIAVGQQAAAGIISLRAGDGLNGPTIVPLPPGPGVWQPTPPNTLGIDSWLGDVTPFLLDSGDALRAARTTRVDECKVGVGLQRDAPLTVQRRRLFALLRRRRPLVSGRLHRSANSRRRSRTSSSSGGSAWMPRRRCSLSTRWRTRTR